MPAVADRAVTYSNPLGATLTPIRENVWWGEREFYPRIPGLSQFDVACKMAVVRLRDGSLWVHAPVALDAATKAAVDALGPVRHVVTPNTEHLKWARQWIDAYPEATSYCCPGLREKRPDIGYDVEVGDACPEAWGGEFECTWVEEERAPFKLLGDRPFFSEVVFCHKPSKVLFVVDLWWNYPESAPRAWKFAMDSIYRPVYNGMRHGHGPAAKILGWDWHCAAPCRQASPGPATRRRRARRPRAAARAARGARTVQGELNAALRTRFGGADIPTLGASRTDAGVHARGQCAHADLPVAPTAAELLEHQINRLLPDDARVHDLRPAPAPQAWQAREGLPWHAIANASGKRCAPADGAARQRGPAGPPVPGPRRLPRRRLRPPRRRALVLRGRARLRGLREQRAPARSGRGAIGDAIRSATLFDEGGGDATLTFELDGALYKMAAPACGLCLEEVYYDDY
ncbi:DUF4336-containing protein [Aureococcus anophagefferens]|nr:DUF4336-containing protein [Aureococcus anophagefferens]